MARCGIQMTFIQFQAGSSTGPSAGSGSAQPPQTELHGGQAVFSNDTYTITTSDHGLLHIHNSETGRDSTLPLPVTPAGGDFRGTAAYQLDDGTTLMLHSLPDADGSVQRDLTIVDGDYAVRIANIASARRVPSARSVGMPKAFVAKEKAVSARP